MIAQRYMVSLQWGGDGHTFVGGADSLQDASKLAKSVAEQHKNARERDGGDGPMPRVMIWEMRETT